METDAYDRRIVNNASPSNVISSMDNDPSSNSTSNLTGNNKRKRENPMQDADNLKIKKLQALDEAIIQSQNNEEDFESPICSSLTSESSNISTQATKNNNDDNKVYKNKNKQPPIVVTINETKSFWHIRDIVNKVYNNAAFKNNGKFALIIVEGESAHKAIIELLKKELIEFHTYQRKDDRKPKIVLKGLPLTSTDELHEELINYKINPESIKLLRAKNNNNINSATYLITVSNTDELKHIKTVKQLFNVFISSEKFHKNNKPTQCYNCQESW